MALTPDPTPAHQAALRLGAAVDDLDVRTRLALAQQTLGAGDEPQAMALWHAIHMLTEGATSERLGHLVSVLEVTGPEVRDAVRSMATRAAPTGGPLRPFWRELAELARIVR